MVLPNFLFIGPDKAGSTWIASALSAHPEVFIAPAKDLYFFDRYFDKGIDWYQRQFSACQGQPVVGEICHDYLYSADAARRIRRTVPSVRMMVTLRDPIDRAMSAYLYRKRLGLFSGSFEQALVDLPELIDHGRYGKWLSTYFELFSRDQLLVTMFDSLRDSPQLYFDELCEWLGVRTWGLAGRSLEPARQAAYARSGLVARLGKALALGLRSAGLPRVLGRLKNSAFIESLLFRPIPAGERPIISDEARSIITSALYDDVCRLSNEINMDLVSRWRFNGTRSDAAS